MNGFDTQCLRITHITIINLLNAFLHREESFDALDKLSTEELEAHRDELLVIYNEAVKPKGTPWGC
jgi:hypothetical protein